MAEENLRTFTMPGSTCLLPTFHFDHFPEIHCFYQDSIISLGVIRITPLLSLQIFYSKFVFKYNCLFSNMTRSHAFKNGGDGEGFLSQ